MRLQHFPTLLAVASISTDGRLGAPRLAAPSSSDSLLTLAEVEAAAKRLGCELSIKATGPTYRIELLWDGGRALPNPKVQQLGYNDEPDPPPELLGYSNGFSQPTGAVHLEAIEVRRYTGFWSRKKAAGAARYDAVKKLSPGLLLAGAVSPWVNECDPFKCATYQLMAIRDDERQHRSLVRFYRRLGFTPLREVGTDFRSIADRVVWGGDGLIMEMNVKDYLRKHGDAIRALGRDA